MFTKTIPDIMETLGQEPLFTIVTASLRAAELITNEELKYIKAKPTPVEKGGEITQKLLNKMIEASDDPVQCLLTICDVFEREDVDNETLRKHGASMRSNFTGVEPNEMGILTFCCFLRIQDREKYTRRYETP